MVVSVDKITGSHFPFCPVKESVSLFSEKIAEWSKFHYNSICPLLQLKLLLMIFDKNDMMHY